MKKLGKTRPLPPKTYQLTEPQLSAMVKKRVEEELRGRLGTHLELKGNLHKAPISKWHEPTTTYGNALATCQTYVIAASGTPQWVGNALRNDRGEYLGDQVLEYAAQLVTAIIKGTENHLSVAGDMDAASIAMVCMAQLGWIASEDNASE